ncbi:hypothetical protein ACPYO6_14205 [Georgenia sp. Z1344]|uniref:hypothetical protein n=1 Tax=Georgenia sp. Z1344 TaxID=3416706 RepID=UPI003CE846EE
MTEDNHAGPELSFGVDEGQFAQIGVDEAGRIAYVEIDGGWASELTPEELAAALMEAYGAAQMARVPAEGDEPVSAGGRRIPQVTPIADEVRARLEARRNGTAGGARDAARRSTGAQPDSGIGTEPNRGDQLEQAKRMIELARRAREERELYRDRLMEMYSTEFEDANSEKNLAVVSRHGSPVSLSIGEIWTRRRAEPLARALLEIVDAAAARLDEMNRRLAQDFPATTELITRAQNR